jgi:hypothetical protein
VRLGAGGELAGNSETQSSYETHGVEPDGTGGQILHLTWGDLLRREREEKSADAVVAKRRGNARGAKGGRNQTELGRELKGSCEGV